MRGDSNVTGPLVRKSPGREESLSLKRPLSVLARGGLCLNGVQLVAGAKPHRDQWLWSPRSGTLPQDFFYQNVEWRSEYLR